MGRPTTYDFELVQNVCERLSEGESLKVILSEEGMPARSTFFKWKREHKEFSDLYVKVAQDKGELFIEEIDETIEQLKAGKMDASTANVIIQALKWKAAKFYPKMFGDSVKQILTDEEGKNPFEALTVKVIHTNKNDG